MVERAELQGEINEYSKSGSAIAFPLFGSDDGSRPEIVSAVGAVVGPSPRREPAFAFPRIALARDRLDDRDPPVEQDQNEKTDHPADHGPDHIVNAEQDQPETAVPLAFTGQHRAGAAAFRTSDVQRHTHRSLPF